MNFLISLIILGPSSSYYVLVQPSMSVVVASEGLVSKVASSDIVDIS